MLGRPVVQWFKLSFVTTAARGSGFRSRLGTLSVCDFCSQGLGLGVFSGYFGFFLPLYPA